MTEQIDPLWSYGLSAVGLTVQYLAMKAPKWAWIVGFISQFPWLVYAVVSNQWGFFISSTLYAAVYAYNYVVMCKQERKKVQADVAKNLVTTS